MLAIRLPVSRPRRQQRRTDVHGHNRRLLLYSFANIFLLGSRARFAVFSWRRIGQSFRFCVTEVRTNAPLQPRHAEIRIMKLVLLPSAKPVHSRLDFLRGALEVGEASMVASRTRAAPIPVQTLLPIKRTDFASPRLIPSTRTLPLTMPSIFTRLGTSSPVTEAKISYAPLDGFQNAVQGDIVFDVPNSSRKSKTHFWAYGLDKKSARPLVILHGGPGIPSNYLAPMIDLAASIPIIIYDQIGCGASSHFPDTMGDTSFWVEDLFLAELHNLLKVVEISDDYAVFGHSWGGVLGSRFASERPAGLKKLVLSSTPVSIELWLEAANRLRALLPKDKCDALAKHEAAGTTEDPEYQAATTAFYDLHVIRVVPNPPEVKAALSAVGEDPTVYLTMNGPNEFHITGPLKVRLFPLAKATMEVAHRSCRIGAVSRMRRRSMCRR